MRVWGESCGIVCEFLDQFASHNPSNSRAISTVSFCFLLVILLAISACNDRNPMSQNPEKLRWESLGFEDHLVSTIEIDWPYLYACAAEDGLFRRRINRTNQEWKHLGLADTTRTDSSTANYYQTVKDIAILDNGDILAAVDIKEPYSHGLFRTKDEGLTWKISDSGLFDPWEPFSSNSVQVLVQGAKSPSVVYASTENALFKSEDYGSTWNLEYGFLGGAGTTFDVCIHPENDSSIWIGGVNGVGDAKLIKSINDGASWKRFDLRSITGPSTAVKRVVTDPANSDIVYIAVVGAIIKTRDGGNNWSYTAFSAVQPFLALKIDNRNPEHIFAATEHTIYESWDGGENVTVLQSPTMNSIIDIDYYDVTKILYIATLYEGIYSYRFE